ncbi:DUF1360 domain-containing protein [Rahnella ecdela]|uniref:DUF1360 domain-containing protein n=1 Tax=Rahnella ecdela TaxID=2816250 RepID=A0ABS6LGR8_9GAMM|nr:DUF1360 domain-containing protein [Rahnella ecdela]MBU9845837.1 DUF1360 domain-containing protein [Rahnella ecdela]
MDINIAHGLSALWNCLIIALAASSISMSITQADLFETMRNWIEKKNNTLGHLFKCFYCFSHWVVFAGMVIYHPLIINSNYIVADWLVSAFLTLTLTTFINGLMFKVFQSAISTHVLKARARKELSGDAH